MPFLGVLFSGTYGKTEGLEGLACVTLLVSMRKAIGLTGQAELWTALGRGV
jgi:hypothetical protein